METKPNFISRLNWRQILIHFVAFCFFIYAFQTLVFLYDTKIVDIIRQKGDQDIDTALTNNGTDASDLVWFTFLLSTSGLIGLLVAFIISLIVSLKRKWFWLNPLICLFITYFLYRFNFLGWTYLKKIFWMPGKIFHSTTLEFLISGLILLAIGIFCLFLPKVHRFIVLKIKAV